MPGAYPRSAKIALTNATLPYMLLLADGGMDVLKKNEPLKMGLNTYNGKLTCEAVAEAFGIQYFDPENLL